MRKLLILFFFIYFILFANVIKADFEIKYRNQLGSDFIFYGDNITIEVKCDGEKVEGFLRRSDGSIIWLNFPNLFENKTSLQISQDFYKTTQIDIEINCFFNGLKNTSSLAIHLHTLDFKILDYKAYNNEESYISFIFSIDDTIQQLFDIFEFYLENEKITDYKLVLQPQNKIYYLYFYPSVIGEKNFKIVARYNNRTFETSKIIEIKKPFNVTISYEDKIYLKDEILKINFQAFFKDEKINYKDIEIEIEPPLKFSYCDEDCIYLNLTNLEEGKIHLFKIKFTYLKKYQEIKNVFIKLGKVASGNLNLEANIIFGKETIKTDKYGNYSFIYFPGTLNFSIYAKNFKIEFINAKVDNWEDLIKINLIEPKDLKFIIAFNIQTDLSFEKAKVTFEYSDTVVEDEDKLIVLKCDEYNMNKNTCLGKWYEINFIQNKVRNIITFETTSLSAFALVYKKSLYLDFSTSKNAYWLNEPIIIRGYVKSVEDDKGTKAELKIYINNTLVKTVETNDNGLFELVLDGIEKEGKYKIKIIAKKEFFELVSVEKEIEVKPKIEVKIDVDKTELEEGNNTIIIEIANIGQKDLENLKIEIAGIEANLINNVINFLGINEKERLNANIFVDKNFSNKLVTFSI